jgi:hypothetical protein
VTICSALHFHIYWLFVERHLVFSLRSSATCRSQAFGLPGVQQAGDEELAGPVGGAHERATGGVEEAQLRAFLLPLLELARGHVLEHLQVLLRRLHVLPQSHAVHARRAQICNHE